jgi:hypothetical protein
MSERKKHVKTIANIIYPAFAAFALGFSWRGAAAGN